MIVRSRIDFYNIFQATVLVFVVGSRAGGLGGGRLLLFFFLLIFY